MVLLPRLLLKKRSMSKTWGFEKPLEVRNGAIGRVGQRAQDHE